MENQIQEILEKVREIHQKYLSDESFDWFPLCRVSLQMMGCLYSGMKRCSNQDCDDCQRIRNLRVELQNTLPKYFKDEVIETFKLIDRTNMGTSSDKEN